VAAMMVRVVTKRCGIARDPERNGFIIKKTKAKEAEFYSLLFSIPTDPSLVSPPITERQERLLEKLKPLVPTCVNVERLSDEKKGGFRIWLEDLTHGMKEPCVMDVKLGDKVIDTLCVSKENPR
ncbi:hypothetical protein FOZ63_020323, partial [Perkinsus olseni]